MNHGIFGSIRLVNEKFKFQSHLYAKLILFWYRLISVIIAEYFE